MSASLHFLFLALLVTPALLGLACVLWRMASARVWTPLEFRPPPHVLARLEARGALGPDPVCPHEMDAAPDAWNASRLYRAQAARCRHLGRASQAEGFEFTAECLESQITRRIAAGLLAQAEPHLSPGA